MMYRGKVTQLISVLDAREWLATGCGRLALGTCGIGGAGSRYGDKEKEPRLLLVSNTDSSASKQFSALLIR